MATYRIYYAFCTYTVHNQYNNCLTSPYQLDASMSASPVSDGDDKSFGKSAFSFMLELLLLYSSPSFIFRNILAHNT